MLIFRIFFIFLILYHWTWNSITWNAITQGGRVLKRQNSVHVVIECPLKWSGIFGIFFLLILSLYESVGLIMVCFILSAHVKMIVYRLDNLHFRILGKLVWIWQIVDIIKPTVFESKRFRNKRCFWNLLRNWQILFWTWVWIASYIEDI